MSTQPTAPAAAAPAEPAAPAAPAATSPATGAPATAPATPPETPATTSNVWDDPTAAKAEIEKLRKENGDARVNAKKTAAEEARQTLAQEIAKILNPEAEGKVDPAQLAAQLTTTQQTARQAQIDLAVYQNASHKDVQGDPNALLDSRAFQAKLATLDPAAEDFQTKVLDAMKTAVTDNPKLKAVRAAGQSSVDHAGGSGEANRTLDAQIAEAEKAGNHVLAISLKRQRAYTPNATA